ncbi:MAG: hypothetical protein [Bacteriophage sp.]|nr:MAG: hypothetical protein [Bacteriophage sp.]
MSRSNPTNEIANPANRWFEFSGKNGVIKYYDKEKEEKMELKLPFTFIVLDTLATIKGWNDPSDSGIYSNEVRDITKDVLLVKSFKGPQIAEGFYRDIKNTIIANGGHYSSSVYIAYAYNNIFQIGNIQFKGAALNSWVEFTKANRNAIMKQAIVITGYTEGKKGAVTFKIPTFGLREISASTEETAKDLDKELQEYLNVYLSKKQVVEQVAEVQNQPTDFSQEIDNAFAESAVNPNTGLTQEEELELPF